MGMVVGVDESLGSRGFFALPLLLSLIGLCFFTLPCLAVFSPPIVIWNRSLGNGSCEAFCITSTPRGYALGGRSRERGLAYLLVIDERGEKVLEKTYWWPGDSCAYSIIPCTDGGFAFAGTGQSPYDTSFVLRVSEDGETLWHRGYGGGLGDWARSEARGIVETENGFVVAGTYSRWVARVGVAHEVLKTDIWVFRIDQDGEMVWNKTFGGWLDDYATSITRTGDGFLVTGYGRSFGPRLNAYLMKIDPEGDMVWNQSFDLSSHDYLYQGIMDPDGFIVAAGHAHRMGALVVMVEEDGTRVWETVYGDPDCSAKSITSTPDGGYLLIGSKGYQNSSIWVSKIDREGHTLWERVFGGNETYRGTGITKTPKGGYMVLGNKGIEIEPGDLEDTYPEIFVLEPEPVESIAIKPRYMIPGVDKDLIISVVIRDRIKLSTAWINMSSLDLFDYLPLYDDGTHGDMVAGDSTYTRRIITSPDMPSGRQPVTIHTVLEDGSNWSTRTYCYIFPVVNEDIYDEDFGEWSPVTNNAILATSLDGVALSGNISLVVSPLPGGSLDLIPPGGLTFDAFGFEYLELSINPDQSEEMRPRIFIATSRGGMRTQIDLVDQGYIFSKGNWTQIRIPIQEILNQPIQYIRIGGYTPTSYCLDRVKLTTTIPELFTTTCLVTVTALIHQHRTKPKNRKSYTTISTGCRHPSLLV